MIRSGPIGPQVLQFKILEKLGEGGMGVVYKAEDTRLARTVALKFLPHHMTGDEAEKDRLLQEAKAASALNHPNVCTIFDIKENNDEQFIVMEFVEGATLKSVVKTTQLSVEEIVLIALQTAEGLRAAHAKGIVHRDIKSDNIMVTKDHRIKIMDFGLARLLAGEQLARSRTTAGTIGYTSPEQIKGEDVGTHSDLWSLGIVLYEMLTGQLPFAGNHEAAVIYEVLNVEPPAVISRRREVPEYLQLLVRGLLQKDKSLRPRSAQEVIDRLKEVTSVGSHPGDKSIAVLYFENMSSENESDYFCAGMTEDIITDLSKIKELKVISRTDVLPFRNKEVNTRQVGETLRVNYILEGSVRKSGSKMRITAQLVAVDTGFHVWADRFDRLVEDVFDVQTEVSRKIAEALKISLTESEQQSLAVKPTEDIRAYDLYLRGRELLYLRGKKNNEAAIRMFENALSLDQRFASAYAALGEAYSYMYAWYDGDQKWLGKTREVSQKALALDPNSMEALFSIGTVSFQQKRFDDARLEWKRVIHLNPDFYDAYRWLGIVSDISGSYDEALAYYEQCARLKPYSEEPWMHVYMTHLRQGDSNKANEAKRKLLEVGEQKLKINPDDAITLSRMAGPYAEFGEREKAYAVLKKVLEIDPTDGLAQYNCACTYAVMGERKLALSCLRNAILGGYKNVTEWVKSDPDLLSLHNDPEYEALVAEATKPL
jgi:serine/threonine protein kinase/tetratricopeptide (TPR) repeat protein